MTNSRNCSNLSASSTYCCSEANAKTQCPFLMSIWRTEQTCNKLIIAAIYEMHATILFGPHKMHQDHSNPASHNKLERCLNDK